MDETREFIHNLLPALEKLGEDNYLAELFMIQELNTLLKERLAPFMILESFGKVHLIDRVLVQ